MCSFFKSRRGCKDNTGHTKVFPKKTMVFFQRFKTFPQGPNLCFWTQGFLQGPKAFLQEIQSVFSRTKGIF